MDKEHVDRRQAETLQTVLKGTHDSIVTVIVGEIKRKPSHKVIPNNVFGIPSHFEEASDLGRYDELGARLLTKEMANAMLNEAAGAAFFS